METFFEATARLGRVPMADDDLKPWDLRGWLLWYVIGGHANPKVPFPDRWSYLAALYAGHDPGPIEPVRFWRHEAPMSNLKRCVEIAGEGGARWSWQAFRLLLDWMSWGLGLADEPAKLPSEVQEKLYRTLDLVPWMVAPYDYLGDFAAEKFGGGPNAFFPTPVDLVAMMVKMQIPAEDQDALRWRSVCDPCVGSGRFLLEAGNYCLYLAGQDIDPMMVQMCRINGALYVPWLVKQPPDRSLVMMREALRRAEALVSGLTSGEVEPEAAPDRQHDPLVVGASPGGQTDPSGAAVPVTWVQLDLFGT